MHRSWSAAFDDGNGREVSGTPMSVSGPAVTATGTCVRDAGKYFRSGEPIFRRRTNLSCYRTNRARYRTNGARYRTTREVCGGARRSGEPPFWLRGTHAALGQRGGTSAERIPRDLPDFFVSGTGFSGGVTSGSVSAPRSNACGTRAEAPDQPCAFAGFAFPPVDSCRSLFL